jgi:hypothetical protein
MVKPEPKHEPLSRHLSAVSDAVVMTFDGISRLVGGLPPSAFRYPAWWANDLGGRHEQAHAWLDNGLRVVAVDLDRQVVRFSSDQNREATETIQRSKTRARTRPGASSRSRNVALWKDRL